MKFHLKKGDTDRAVIYCNENWIQMQYESEHVTRTTTNCYDETFDNRTIAEFAIIEVNAHLELGWTITRVEL